VARQLFCSFDSGTAPPESAHTMTQNFFTPAGSVSGSTVSVIVCPAFAQSWSVARVASSESPGDRSRSVEAKKDVSLAPAHAVPRFFTVALTVTGELVAFAATTRRSGFFSLVALTAAAASNALHKAAASSRTAPPSRTNPLIGQL
jgi:hypothetical protein